MWKLWSQIIPSVVLAVEQNGILFREVDYVAVKGSFEERNNTGWKQFGLIKGFWTENQEPECTRFIACGSGVRRFSQISPSVWKEPEDEEESPFPGTLSVDLKFCCRRLITNKNK